MAAPPQGAGDEQGSSKTCVHAPLASPASPSRPVWASPRSPPVAATPRPRPGSTGDAAAGGKKIALLLPESKTTRYETFDKPLFEAAVKAACADCTVIYSNADQDAAKQQQQAESALTQGADVLVLDPVDGKAAASVVASAKAQQHPGRGLRPLHRGRRLLRLLRQRDGRQAPGADPRRRAEEGGKTSGDLVMINGSPTDPNAADFKAGAHSVLDGSGYKIAAEYDTPDWSPDKAQAVDGGPDRRGQEQPRRRLRRQRRHRRWRHRGPQGWRRNGRSRP